MQKTAEVWNPKERARTESEPLLTVYHSCLRKTNARSRPGLLMLECTIIKLNAPLREIEVEFQVAATLHL